MSDRVCEIDGCNISLEGRHWRTKYCSSYHRQKAYMQTHKGKISNKKRGKKYYYSKKGKATRRSYLEKPEIREREAARTKSNKYRAQKSAYAKSPKGKEKRRKYQQFRRARQSKARASLTENEWQKTLKDFEYSCYICGSRKNLEQDHFIPISEGGDYSEGNILPACRKCNASKHASHPRDFLSSGLYRRVKMYLNARANHLPTKIVYNG